MAGNLTGNIPWLWVQEKLWTRVSSPVPEGGPGFESWGVLYSSWQRGEVKKAFVSKTYILDPRSQIVRMSLNEWRMVGFKRFGLYLGG